MTTITGRICRDDEGAIIHDDISSLDDSQASEFDDDEVEKAVNDDPFVSFYPLQYFIFRHLKSKKFHGRGDRLLRFSHLS